MNFKNYLKFFHIALPFAVVNGVVWGIGVMTLPILAKTSSKAGMTFAMINLGIGIGAIIWSKLSHKFQVRNLIFASSFLSFLGWLAIVLLHGEFLIPLAFVFGTSAAGIFALASVIVTNTYKKEEWDKYISLMQAFMTFGTVVGLVITSAYSSAVIGIPFLILAFVSYIPLAKSNGYIIKHHTLSLSMIKPKMHFDETFTGYFYNRLKAKHFSGLKNKRILLLNLGWVLSLLAAAPIYAMYPLLMKHMFHISNSSSSLIYALSTALGVYFFISAGKLSEKKSPLFPFFLGLALYFSSFIFMFLGAKIGVNTLGAVGFVVMIIAWSFISVGMNVSIVKFASKDKQAELLGVANTLQSFDNVAGGFLGGAVASFFGYYYVVIFGGIFSLLSLGVGLYLLSHKH